MKLKKIASLALAGLMAVSMLAGCGDNSSSNGNGTVVEPGTSSSIVSAFNDKQDATNDVKITFSADSSLNNRLAQIVKEVGVDAEAHEVAEGIRMLNGMKLAINDHNMLVYDDFANNEEDGQKITRLFVVTYDMHDVWNEGAAINKAAVDFNDTIEANFPETTYDKDTMVGGDTYYDYSYTGTVSIASAKDGNGYTVYYVAYTVTQTATEKELNV